MKIQHLTLLAILLIFHLNANVQKKIPKGRWHSINKMEIPTWDEKILSFSGDDGIFTITVLSDDIIRVRFTQEELFKKEHSYAVIKRDFGEANVICAIDSTTTKLKTRSLQIVIQYNPFQISIIDSEGNLLDEDDPERGIALSGKSFRIAKRLSQDTHVYGFGQKNGRLDKRGLHLGGYHLVMWNSDTYCYDSSTDPTYVSVPFYMTMKHGKAYGIFLDNTWRSTFDIGRESQDLLTFGAEGGEIDYYFINGPHPKQVLERYTALTGRSPLPPYWALGYHQCRWSYYPELKVRKLAETFREKKIPIDALWLDIHYQDEYKPFTWNRERFPTAEKMISDLREQGIRTVCIVDPHPKVEEGYEPYDSGIIGDHFVKKCDGTVFKGPVWPSCAEKNPGLSVFPDFSRIQTRQWWGDLYKSLLDMGVAGIWNDMNEPAIFLKPAGTMPCDMIHDNEDNPTDHREIHNVYGQLMTRSTFAGLQKLHPNERPFVLTRSTFAGGQQFAAVWTGDNAADWASLRQSIYTSLGMGLSGFSFVGSDIGGFSKPTSAELFTRWLQVGVFSPFMRSHAEIASPDKEPWVYGEVYEAINKQAIELRYQLLPYIYNEMQKASNTGIPAMRPLFLEFPHDQRVASIDDEFLFGSDLLVAPILWEGAKQREVYLPNGDWFDYSSKCHYKGGKSVTIHADLDLIPLLVRGGGFIFHQPTVQHTGEMIGNSLYVLIFPAKDSSSIFYEDDGVSFNYVKGEFLRRKFHQIRNESEINITITVLEGSYRPPERSLVIEVVAEKKPTSVSLSLLRQRSTAVSPSAKKTS